MAVNIVEILVKAKDMTAEGFGEAEAQTSKFGEKLQKLGLVAGAAVAVGLYEGVKAATDFNSQMERLVTQAGLSQSKLAGLKSGVLSLAGEVGFSPDSLAESLYHVASNMATMGATSQQMLNVVKVAAEGAKVGGADLVDVTNALTAAVASGIPGVQNYSQAMGALNAIVGSGDMKMQDLAEAFGSGMVATVKGFGLSLTDVGAALAVFGDNNIRGAHAGNQLRMSVMALAAPAAAGVKILKDWGIGANQLAVDMQHGGLMKALDDFMTHMRKAGVTAQQQGQYITEIFGKKAGAGLNVLLDQMDRLKSKYPAITKGAKDFGAAWADTQKQFKQQLAELGARFEAFAITVGEKVLPVVQDLVGFLSSHASLVQTVATVFGILTAALLTYIGTVKVVEAVTKAWAVIQAILDGELTANPIGLVIVAIAALVAGIIYAYKHFKGFRDAVHDVWDALKVTFEWVKGHWRLLFDILTGPIGMAVMFIVQHWRMIYDGAVRTVNDVISWFKRLPGMIMNAVTALPMMLYNVGKNAIMGLWHGAESVFSGLLSTAENWGHDLANAIGGVFGIHFSEPSQATKMITAGQNIARGLARGITTGRPDVAAAFAGLPLGGGYGAAGGGPGGGWMELRATGAGAENVMTLIRLLWPGLQLEVRQRGGQGPFSVQKALGHTWPAGA